MSTVLLLIAHFLGDFIFQSSKLAKNKLESTKLFIIHCVIYSVVILAALISFGPIQSSLLAFLIIVITHAAVDYGRIYFSEKYRKKLVDSKSLDFGLFIIDQILHIAIILYCGYLVTDISSIGNFIKDNCLRIFNWNQCQNAIVYILLYIICLSPSAVFIKKVFILFSIQSEGTTENKEELLNSGYLIGILERIIILTLGLNGQLGAIGFVMAAKSLARFKQLEEKSFAEKYLVGTLMSVAIALFCITFGRMLLV